MSTYEFEVGVSVTLGENPDNDATLTALAQSGMRHVEIMYRPHADDPNWADTVRSRLDAASVNINSVHAPFSQEVDISRLEEGGQAFAIEQVRKAISLAARLGVDIVVMHGSAEPIEPERRAERIAQSRRGLRLLGQDAQAAGVRLALELLPRTCLGNNAAELDILLTGVPATQAGFCLDTNHLADPAHVLPTVSQLGRRLITLHISDYDGTERHWMPFDGVVDWGGFANALQEIGYGGAFIYEAKLVGETMPEKLANVESNFRRILDAAVN